MFICEIWLFDWYLPQFYTSDMSNYRYLEVFQGVFDCENRLYLAERYSCPMVILPTPKS